MNIIKYLLLFICIFSVVINFKSNERETKDLCSGISLVCMLLCCVLP